MERLYLGASDSGVRLRRPVASERQSNVTHGARFLVQRVWSLAEEAGPGRGIVSSPTMLFALGDMCRSGLFRGSATVAMMGCFMHGHWRTLGEQRACYVGGGTLTQEECVLGSRGRITMVAGNVIQLARLLAQDDAGDGPLRLRHLWLSLLLQPNPHQVGALELLAKLGQTPAALREEYKRHA